MIGDVPVGGGAPVSVQSMTKTDTRDAKATLAQIRDLAEAGCDIIRVATPDMDAIDALRRIIPGSPLPVIADIHFDYKLAIAAVEAGAHGLRINPGNISKAEHLKRVIALAEQKKISIRIGINSGSIPGGKDPVSLALRYAKIFEGESFRDIVISIKSSDVLETIEEKRDLTDDVEQQLKTAIEKFFATNS